MWYIANVYENVQSSSECLVRLVLIYKEKYVSDNNNVFLYEYFTFDLFGI